MPFQVLLDIVDIAALSVVNTIGHYFVRLIVLCSPFFPCLFSTMLMVNKDVYRSVPVK